jgi:hypothetical protein
VVAQAGLVAQAGVVAQTGVVAQARAVKSEVLLALHMVESGYGIRRTEQIETHGTFLVDSCLWTLSFDWHFTCERA